MKLSISRIKLFKACRRAYELKYVYGVIPTGTADALETGLNYHAMIEELHRTGNVPDCTTKEAAMANAYYHYVYPQMPKFEPEVWFEKSLGYGRAIIGRLDGKVESEAAIVEHKTTSLPVEEYVFNLQYDEQLLTYMLATGVRTAYYTICRKPTIRQKQSETLDEYAQRCLSWYAEDTDDKIRMVKITCTDEEVVDFKKELVKMFSEVKSGHYYRNCSHCNAWGKKCEYYPICHNYEPTQEYVGFTREEVAE